MADKRRSPVESKDEGRARAVIDAVFPTLDGGRHPIKMIVGEPVRVEAHCFTDGHDRLRTVLTWRETGAADAFDVEMAARGNDVWTAEFTPSAPGRYRFTVSAWVDHFESWRSELERRDDPNDIRVALQAGAVLIGEAAARARAASPEAERGAATARAEASTPGAAPTAAAIRVEAAATPRASLSAAAGGDAGDSALLEEWATRLQEAAAADTGDVSVMKALALDPVRAAACSRHPDRRFAVTEAREVVVDRARAAFSAWYEFFPRSSGSVRGRHGTLRDAAARLAYAARMGFDVVYFPPIHPIGRINRKGPNNSLTAAPDDVGSPWAIGSTEGGHKSILPELGTLEDFHHVVATARQLGMEIALDIAFQCAPDHPYVTAHPAWFKHRPDGSVQYAENPPKKYQDIYPFDFESTDWRALWDELKSVMDYWIEQGVKIFRVDNPHTKSFAFWEWALGAIKAEHPDVLFLAEAFTRPKVMHRLAKVGFSQSYTYFTWRNSKRELVEYFTELSKGPGTEYFRPNVWPNTPDILHEALQSGSRAVFASRAVLAATLSANYGIYGPAYELLESTPRERGSEEYRNSEKYQLRNWAWDRADSLWPLIARLNRIRRACKALQSDRNLMFCPIGNDQLIAYVKVDVPANDVILTIVNLDPYNSQSGFVDLDLAALDIPSDRPFQVHDLLSDQRFEWSGGRNYVILDPYRMPAHVFKVRNRTGSELKSDLFT